MNKQSDFPLSLVGELFYQDNIEAICGPRKKAGENKVVQANLILEDSNPHDNLAVMVKINDKKVGHLSRQDARTYRQLLAQKRVATTCQALIKGGWDRGDEDRGHYGVYLALSLRQPAKSKSRSRPLQIVAIIILLCVAFYFIGRISDRLYPSQRQNIQTQPQNTPAQPQFSILKQWQPDNNPAGFGADILLEEDLSQEELVSFIKTQAGDKDPALITIWTSQAAYDQNQKNEFGPEFKEGYIAFYVKNKTGQGAYAGFNEIRWMQEVGKFSHLYGQTTRF